MRQWLSQFLHTPTVRRFMKPACFPHPSHANWASPFRGRVLGSVPLATGDQNGPGFQVQTPPARCRVHQKLRRRRFKGKPKLKPKHIFLSWAQNKTMAHLQVEPFLDTCEPRPPGLRSLCFDRLWAQAKNTKANHAVKTKTPLRPRHTEPFRQPADLQEDFFRSAELSLNEESNKQST